MPSKRPAGKVAWPGPRIYLILALLFSRARSVTYSVKASSVPIPLVSILTSQYLFRLGSLSLRSASASSRVESMYRSIWPNTVFRCSVIPPRHWLFIHRVRDNIIATFIVHSTYFFGKVLETEDQWIRRYHVVFLSRLRQTERLAYEVLGRPAKIFGGVGVGGKSFDEIVPIAKPYYEFD